MNGGGGGGADVGWLLIRGVQAAAVHAKSPIGMSTTNCFELQVGGYNCKLNWELIGRVNPNSNDPLPLCSWKTAGKEDDRPTDRPCTACLATCLPLRHVPHPQWMGPNSASTSEWLMHLIPRLQLQHLCGNGIMPLTHNSTHRRSRNRSWCPPNMEAVAVFCGTQGWPPYEKNH
ncbi:hypothetical protein MUK42_23327 [Musa troglodytarum]|uniref:Uncharacterized protein n=1 Tax=Musa troglodytarum TaxID=320322 RepID=A0A9E7GDX2_9LILI|nr:hypothetical protein MUK42_23327 [Musa troglodytarum]